MSTVSTQFLQSAMKPCLHRDTLQLFYCHVKDRSDTNYKNKLDTTRLVTATYNHHKLSHNGLTHLF